MMKELTAKWICCCKCSYYSWKLGDDFGSTNVFVSKEVLVSTSRIKRTLDQLIGYCICLSQDMLLTGVADRTSKFEQDRNS